MENSGIKVKIIRKNMRSIRLHVNRFGEVVCTASFLESEQKIQKFIEEKKDWIEKSVQKVKKSRQNNASLNPDGVAAKSGFLSSDRIRGQSNFKYSALWKKSALKNFMQSAGRLSSFFEKNALPEFTVKGRSMHSMWGNCNTKNKTITLSWELFNFPQECIDYVVFHEMTHFLYIYHDKNFYSYIERYMPDFRKIAKNLS